MVAVTGSLAMNNIANRADIDFMIATANGHLWTSRAFVLGIARLAALHGVRICPNYMITENAMILSDRSLYTAHELTQMVPLFGMKCYNQLRALNPWTEKFLPNANGIPHRQLPNHPMDRSYKIQAVLQGLLLTPPGNWFEQWEMDRKIRRLTNEQVGSGESSFSADYCKGHVHRHGHRTGQLLRKRLESIPLEGYS
jgi:hypothetical protein